MNWMRWMEFHLHQQLQMQQTFSSIKLHLPLQLQQSLQQQMQLKQSLHQPLQLQQPRQSINHSAHLRSHHQKGVGRNLVQQRPKSVEPNAPTVILSQNSTSESHNVINQSSQV